MKIRTYVLSTLLLTGTLSAQNINIIDGWQLLGATQDLNTTQFDEAGCVDYLWKYNNTATTDAEKWQLHISNTNITTTTQYTPIKTLNAGEGYWAKSSASCNITLDDSSNSIEMESLISAQTLYVMTQSPEFDSQNNIISNTVNVAQYMFNSDLTLEADGGLSGMVGAWKVANNNLYYTFAPAVIDTMTNYHEYVSGSISDGCVKLNHIFPEPSSNIYPGVYFTDRTIAENYAVYLNDLNTTATDCPTDIGVFDESSTPSTGNSTIDYGDGTLTFNGLTYGIVTSPYTERMWLDRNLGATQICDTGRENYSYHSQYEEDMGSCFGDYYQWGRNADGHEKKDSEMLEEASSSTNPDGGFFYIKNSDWTTGDEDGILRVEYWSKTDGSSVCPVGFRVPTYDELHVETVSSVTSWLGKFPSSNFLKAPTSGLRTYGVIVYNGDYGLIDVSDRKGFLWTTDFVSDTSYYENQANIISFDTGSMKGGMGARAIGAPVRCIKD